MLAIKLSKATTREAVANERVKAAEEMSQQQAERLKAESERMAAESEQRFSKLAAQLLNDSARTLKEQSETQLTSLLTPLKSDLERFGKTVDETYRNEARERISLSERIKQLVELNNSLSTQAKELVEALRGNSKVQGDWGEMILERLLEKSGLIRDIHYTVQQTRNADGTIIHDEKGRGLRPDVIINYPDNRCLVIDSKVSLTAYVNHINADDPDIATTHARAHLASVRAHIKELADKNYQDYIGSKMTDFVMMFIPNEGAYLTAMNLEPDLWQQAYNSRVIIISPTHLLAVLKLVEQLWRQDDIQRNATTIAVEAGKMYDKLVGFVDEMNRVDRALQQARAAYDSAFARLSTGRGNLVKRAADLKRMGAKATKSLPDSLTEVAGEDDYEQPTIDRE